jgi:drug/metabolite transporter (DMT)-like permease
VVWLWLGLTMVGWGSGVLLMKLAARGIDPLTAIVFNLPGYLLVGLWVLPWAKPGLSRYHLAAVGIGSVYVIGNLAFFKLCKTQPISILAPLTSLYVLIPTLAGVVLLAERPTRLQWAGMALALIALVMLTWPRKPIGQADRNPSATATQAAGLEARAAFDRDRPGAGAQGFQNQRS